MLPKGPYNPKQTEEKILDFWLENKFYKPEYSREKGGLLKGEEVSNDQRESFSIVLPPPNANGNLHLGHMSGYLYQDLMGRYNRMLGKKVLLLPGKDHAGIQTEVVFEKFLEEKGISKRELGREEFYKQCYQFCMDNSETARQQEKNIGLSADFERELFTLDPKIVDEVLKAFELMYEDGLIYRGKRLINWCPRCQSALADIDTEFKDSKSKFFYFKYGFPEPDKKALELKNRYENQEIEFNVTAANLPSQSNVNVSPTTIFRVSQIEDYIEVLPIGYNFKPVNQNFEELEGITVETRFQGKVIGIQMQLDGQFKLVVANPNHVGDIQPKIHEIFLDQIKKYAGAHIILFDDYKEDKYYTNGFILGTVRPETKFGDTAIAADPDDERYTPFVGKTFEVKTLNGNSKINFIADNAVEESFGTGIVKVTPAHAPEDWDIASRHVEEAMPEKQVIDFDGKLNHLTGKYNGLTVNEARRVILEDMKEEGMLIWLDEEYENRVRICERCKSRIEPLVSHQWFVDTAPLKKKAKQLVEDNITQILPEGKEKVYLDWMNSPEDWCITRQLWWGYRIPVWYKGKKEQFVTEEGLVKEKIGDKIMEDLSDYEEYMYVGHDKPDGDEWIQDEDVLDTWFSSGQWPCLTLKVKDGDFDQFYPTQVMETGWDILIFWVTRMMLLNPYRAEKLGFDKPEDQTPFSNVYLHGLVLDKNGKKMSKSKGNGIDPFQMMDKFGTDALRFSFVVGNAVGQNYRLYEEKISSYAKFCNKIWNATRFVLMNIEGVDTELVKTIHEAEFAHKSNQELYAHIAKVKKEVSHLLDTFQFGVAAQVLYNEFWHSFCDIHIEESKPHTWIKKDKETGEIISQPEVEERRETQGVLLYALREYMKMLHPFIPFITEEIWAHMPKLEEDSKSIMYQEW